ncbi:hypothetical protein CDAR_565221 [Caerostris darwini]|uniref:Uncharacterized protein n=1 Tax=Caerostris darwini TaxID=1538125 RepID=A0AAV4TWT7_9ARAC|nr:hypothetical protein CDAR_565221 [Caerostris darwini]
MAHIETHVDMVLLNLPSKRGFVHATNQCWSPLTGTLLIIFTRMRDGFRKKIVQAKKCPIYEPVFIANVTCLKDSWSMSERADFREFVRMLFRKSNKPAGELVSHCLLPISQTLKR